MNCLRLLASAALLALVTTAGLRGGTESPLLTIQGGQLLDSNSGKLEPVGAVVISGDRIREVLPLGKALPVPSGATVIEAAGKFLLPGFIDGHAHVAHAAAPTAATRNNAQALNESDRLGSIEPGKLADLMIFDADPLADIRTPAASPLLFAAALSATRPRS